MIWPVPGLQAKPNGKLQGCKPGRVASLDKLQANLVVTQAGLEAK